MGEHAWSLVTHERVKIGTCEDLLYLRPDQARRVTRREDGDVRPTENPTVWRFRFPFPDEDKVAPGHFNDPFRTLGLHIPAPVEFDHGTVQFLSSHPRKGFLVSLPCPEGPEGDPRVHRNGYSGATHVVQQRVWDGKLVTVCECGGCGHKYRLETLEAAEPVLVAIRSQADHRDHEARLWNQNHPNEQPVSSSGDWYHAIADRITAGYTDPPDWARITDPVGSP